MPSSITHAYLAEDVFKRLDKDIQTKINLENFKTYSEGPDIFYFYHLMMYRLPKSANSFSFPAHLQYTYIPS